MSERKRVCVDLDGVIAQYDGWKGKSHFGDVVPGVKDFLKRLQEKYEICVYTARQTDLHLVYNYLDRNDVPYDVVWDGRGKPQAVAYLDDRAVVAGQQDMQVLKLHHEEYWGFIEEEIESLEEMFDYPKVEK